MSTLFKHKKPEQKEFEKLNREVRKLKKKPSASTVGSPRLSTVTPSAVDSYSIQYLTKSTNIDSRFEVILCDATTGNITIGLPLAKDSKGTIFKFKKIDSSANTVIISASGTDTIDGSTSTTITKQNQDKEIYSNGEKWFVDSVIVADDIIAGTITGSTIQTTASGQRVVLNGSNNSLEIYDSTNNLIGKFFPVTDGDLLIAGDSSGSTSIGYGTTGEFTVIHQDSISTTLSIKIGSASGTLTLGADADTNLYRSAANTLKTDDSLIVVGNLTVDGSYGLVAADMPASIDATKLADGTVTNTELQYINTVTSNVQTQINTKRGYLSGVYTGAPGAGVGSNGDIAYDEDLGGKYVKINGSWISF